MTGRILSRIAGASIAGLSWGVFAQDAISPPPGQRLLLFVGSNTLGERAVPELAQAYLKTQKKARSTGIHYYGELIYVTGTLPDEKPVYIEIHATGSGDCFKSFMGLYPAANAPCDIGMSSRRVKREEADAIKEKTGSDFFMQGHEPGEGCEHPVGMDGIAIITHKDVPVARISFSELARSIRERWWTGARPRPGKMPAPQARTRRSFPCGAKSRAARWISSRNASSPKPRR